MKTVARLLAFAAITTSAVLVHAGIITNGSFESTPTPIASGTFTNFTAPTNIGGWTIVGVDSSVVNSFTQGLITFQAQDGHNWIDLAGVTSNNSSSGVTQNIATQIGAAYQLSFYVGSASDNFLFSASTVDLSIGGNSRVGYTNEKAPSNMLDWKKFIVPFTAQNTSTSITFYNGSASSNFLSGLDNVTVEAIAAVPEPSSILVILGMAISVITASRSRRA